MGQWYHPPPRAGVRMNDHHEIATDSVYRLHVRDVGSRSAPAIVIAGHAMMVDSRTLLREDRPCLVDTLVQHGLRVLVPDLRGHGASGPRAEDGGDWSYEDLVADVPRYLQLARALAPDTPLVLLGHSLFGHVALAHLALHPEPDVAAVVALGVDVWQPQNEPSAARWAVKVAVLAGTSAVTRVVGRLPVRAARQGTNDEAPSYWASFLPLVRRGWRTASGISLGQALVRVRCPVLHVVSRGDRLYAHPDSAIRCLDALPNRTVIDLGRTPGLAHLRPDHMGMVTDPSSRPLWDVVARFIADQIAD